MADSAGQTPRRELMRQLSALREQLRQFGIRDAADYAEVLAAEVLKGQRVANRVVQGYDVLTKRYGRIEVKCRQLPRDGRVEERVEVGAGKEGRFEHSAVVIFDPDFAVKGAVLVPYSAVWNLVVGQAFNRVSYAEACKLPGSLDITPAVKAAATR